MVKTREESLTQTFFHLPFISPAMRSGTGASVVNGRWAVDPPGEYQAGGTSFTYARPRAQTEGEEERGESLRARGPTTTKLQLYVRAGTQEGFWFNPASKHASWNGKIKLMTRNTHSLIDTHVYTHLHNIVLNLRRGMSALCQYPPDRLHYGRIKTAIPELSLSHIIASRAQ